MGRNVAHAAAAAAATHENKPDISDYAKQSKPTFPISQLPDLRETLDPKADMNPEEMKSREEFTTVYDIIDSMEATLEPRRPACSRPAWCVWTARSSPVS